MEKNRKSLDDDEQKRGIAAARPRLACFACLPLPRLACHAHLACPRPACPTCPTCLALDPLGWIKKLFQPFFLIFYFLHDTVFFKIYTGQTDCPIQFFLGQNV